jgi:TatD family-associated radical SAM protein
VEQPDVYAYPFGENLYINLTNRCWNDCQFCLRRGSNGVGGHYLWLKKEPSVQDVVGQMGSLKDYGEIVFCGFGEPMMRLDTLLKVAAYCKEYGKSVRIDTSGLANLYYGEDITPRLEGLVDTVSISLNATNARDYEAICYPQFGEESYEGMLAFAHYSKTHVKNVIFTVIDNMSDEQIERSRRIADELGVTLRIREYIEPEV